MHVVEGMEKLSEWYTLCVVCVTFSDRARLVTKQRAKRAEFENRFLDVPSWLASEMRNRKS
jgi:hypothetical protein